MTTQPIIIPSVAITRHVVETDYPGLLDTVQQSFAFVAPAYATLAAWMAAHFGEPMSVLILDHNRILPYTALEILVWAGTAYSTNTLYEINAVVPASATTPALAAAAIRDAINAWRVQFQGDAPDLASLRVASDTLGVLVFMPFGMLGTADVTYTGPAGSEGWNPIHDGVDNPLWYGIVGPRRHCMRVQAGYGIPYYGDPPLYYYEPPIG